ncbi:zinc transporter zip1 [Anaeramoeba ignava]|uniref:Zinc transporter zip1 n=1 Tax=Anaeramoeba ignava TaxID=1746090 RepID=A0A9Q0LKC9_ANAIG|nr:zinc transporter zip1 [Anaeramoeba ignava]
MEVSLLKIISLFIILGLGLIGGFLPYFIPQTSELKINAAESFAAGVFLGVALIQMLHESEKQLMSEGIKFPFGLVACGVGFFLTLVLENVVAPILSKKSQRKIKTHWFEISKPPDVFDFYTFFTPENSMENSNDESTKTSNKTSEEISENSAPQSSESEEYLNESKPMDAAPMVNRDVMTSKVLAVVISVSLCFHAVLEGLAIGVAVGFRQVLGISIAIMVHKVVEGFSLGISLVRAFRANRIKVTIYVLIFAFSDPIGIMLGMLISRLNTLLVCSLIMAFAAGTFLFAATYDFKNVLEGRKPISKILLAVLGFGLVTIVAVWD